MDDVPMKHAPTGPGERLAAEIERAGRIVALDVFDTLVERSIRPEHVKILACDRLARQLGLRDAGGQDLYALRQGIERSLGQRARAETGETEFRHAEMALALHASLRAGGLLTADVDAAGFAAIALRAELAVERQVLRAKQGAVAALEGARRRGQRVLLLSDFYMPADAVAALLAHAGIDDSLYEALHVSCDRGMSKRTGRLYDLVLRELGAEPGSVTMIGDNPHSDLAMARARGLRAVLVEDAAQVAFYASRAAEVARGRDVLARLRGLIDAPDAPAEHVRQVVPALLLFTERLHAEARRRGIAHLFFLAREGQVLRHLFDVWQDALGLPPAERIATHYVLASRRACYIASLGPLPEEDFAALFAQYRRISLADFGRSLGFTAEEAEALAASIGVDPHAPEADFPESRAYRALRAAPAFRALYEARRREQRDGLRAYLSGFGVDLERHPLAVVDCGWKGSIQDFLRGALPPTVAVEGFYIGLLAAGQPLAGKTGLLFSNVGGLSRDYVVFAENRSLFEVVLCADHGSAARYRRLPDGRVHVDCTEDPEERRFVEGVAMPVVRDLLEVFREVAALRAMTVLPRPEWEKAVAGFHAELVFRPWQRQAGWLLRAHHRESFGVFHLNRVAANAARPTAERLRFLGALLRRPRQVLNGSFWPASAIHAHGGRIAVRAYALARRLRGRMREARP